MELVLDHPFPEYCGTCQGRDSCPFPTLPIEALERLRAITHTRAYRVGSTIFWQGEQASGLHVIRSGYVKLFHAAPDSTIAALEFAGPGTILDLTEVMTTTPYEESAVALMESQVEYLEKDEFLSFLRDNLTLGLKLLEVLGRQRRKSQAELYLIGGKMLAGARLQRKLADLAHRSQVKGLLGVSRAGT